MKNRKKKIASLLLTAAMTAALLTAPVRAAENPNAFRVGSIKGSTLNAGEISPLIVAPYGITCTAVSSNPDVVAIGRVLNYWTANAKAAGTATITVTTPDGRTASMTITVKPAAPVVGGGNTDLEANMAIRQEMVRLINEVRGANGVPELPVNAALMDAAQTISSKEYTQHNTLDECTAVRNSGYPSGVGSNLTAFTNVDAADIARHAVNNWVNSPDHFRAMIDPRCDGIGVGVTVTQRMTYCHMFVGIPNSYLAY